MGASLQPLKQPRMHSSLCFVASLAVVSANVGSQVSFNGMTHAVNHLAGGDRLAAAAHASALQAQGFQGGFQGFQGPATAGFQGGFRGFQGPAAPGFQGQFQGFQGPAAAPAALLSRLPLLSRLASSVSRAPLPSRVLLQPSRDRLLLEALSTSKETLELLLWSTSELHTARLFI